MQSVIGAAPRLWLGLGTCFENSSFDVTQDIA
jgi:hypothetical protein